MSLKDAHFVNVAGVSGTTAGSPIADFNAGGTISDTVCMSKYNKAYFLLSWGVGTTGTTTVTAIPIDSVGGTTTTAIPFRYKIITTPDTNAAWVTASSLLTTAASHKMYVFEVNADDLPLVSGVKYEYVYLNFADTNSDPLLGGCIIIMDEPRIAEDVSDTVTA